MNNKLSENLKKIRKENNLSQEQLAEILNVSRQSISKWESNQAYPEMDKLLQICDKFNLNINDLLHSDISEVKGEEETKIKVNKSIESFLNYITDTINLFSSMTFKSKMKCLFEQAVIICILLIVLSILGGIFQSIFYSSFHVILKGKLYYILYNFFEGIYLIAALIVSLVIIIHTFKIRYLDYYKNEVIEKDDNHNEEKQDNQGEEKLDIKKEKLEVKNSKDKIIIRDPKHSEYKFINGLLKCIIFSIKSITFFINLFFCMSLVGLIIALVLLTLIYKTKLLFIGLFITVLAFCSINIDVILVLFNFIFSRKTNMKRIIYSFIISLVVIGLGLGFAFIGALNIDVKERELKVKQLEFNMDEETFFHDRYQMEFIEEERDNLKVEFYHYNNSEAEYYVDQITDGIEMYSTVKNPFKFTKDILKELNNGIIYTDNTEKIKVYASKENIEKLNKNKYEFYRADNCNCYEDDYDYYEDENEYFE